MVEVRLCFESLRFIDCTNAFSNVRLLSPFRKISPYLQMMTMRLSEEVCL